MYRAIKESNIRVTVRRNVRPIVISIALLVKARPIAVPNVYPMLMDKKGDIT